MRDLIEKILWGKNNLLGGLIALAVVGSIALGCNCTKDLDLSNTGSSSNSSSTDNPFGSNSNKSSSDTDSEMPDEDLMVALVRETTAEFAAAISNDDFSDLYDKASTDFQSTYTEEQTKNTFKEFVQRKSVVLPILAKATGMEPEFSPNPSIRTEKGLSILVTTGKYDTKPVPMRFEYEYIKRGGEWKMLKLVVKLTK